MITIKKLGKKLGLTNATLGLTCLLGEALSQDTYYDNSIYCNTHHCYVDWSQAVDSIGNYLSRLLEWSF